MRPVEFFAEVLTHVKGELANKPLKLEPWQQSILANLYGWKRPDGTRRYRETLIYVPRKNGKTALAAGIILYTLFCDGERGAEIYGAASTYEQACFVFQQARGMVIQESELRSRCRVFNGQAKSITREDVMSFYRPIASEATASHGQNTHLAVIDELHALKDRELYDVLKTSMGARRQPLLVSITTADFEREGSICNELHGYASQVRDGVVSDPYFLPVIYEATSKDDWKSEETWRKCNPNLGISISTDSFSEACQKAQTIAAYENTFKRLHLNIRTEQDVRWLALETWDRCGQESIDEDELAGRACFAGVDLSTTTDVSACVLVFPPECEGSCTTNDGTFDVLPFFWVPRAGAEKRSKKDRVDYVKWIRDGYMFATDGDVVDYDAIREHLRLLAERYNICEVAIDRWNSTQLQTQLMGDGMNVVQFGQGFASMTAPTKELEKLIIANRLRHGSNPVLRWMASNVSVEQDAAGNMKPSKKKSAEKIDGIVALIMALGRSMVSEVRAASVYETRGIEWV